MTEPLEAEAIQEQELPVGWAWVRLADVCLNPNADIVDGPFGSNLKASEYTDAGVPIVRLQNISRNKFIFKEIKFITSEKAEQLSRHNFQPEDVLITKLGIPLGKACLSPKSLGRGVIVADIVRLRISHVFISNQFLVYAINYAPSALKHFAGETKGTTRPRVNLSHIRELPIPLPPLEEQRRIVEKLEALFSELDSAVQSLEAALSKLKRYRQAVLKAAVEGELSREWREANQGQLEPASELLKRILAERRQRWEEAELAKMQAKGKIPQDDKWKARYVEPEGVDSRELPELPEGWVWTSLEQLGFISGGLTKNPKREKLETKLPYLRVANVYADELRLDDIELIGIETEELERTLLEPGDLLVVEGNGSPDQIGRVALWDGSVKPCVHQNHIIKVRLVEKSLNRWGLIFLLSLLGRQLIMSVASSTSGLYTLSLSKVASLRIVLPNIKEVSFIVQEVDRLLSEADKTEEAIRASLKRAERLRQAVLREAFSGRLVPQDPADEPAAVLLERIRAARQAEGGKKGSGKRKAQALLL